MKKAFYFLANALIYTGVQFYLFWCLSWLFAEKPGVSYYAIPLFLSIMIICGAATNPAWRDHWCHTLSPRERKR